MATKQESKGALSIGKARGRLIEEGICSVDGSGDSNVEGLFTRIAMVRSMLLEWQKEGEQKGQYSVVAKTTNILNWL